MDDVASLALFCAILGVVCVALTGPGKLIAVGLGIFALLIGMFAYRSERRPAARFRGAAAVALGLLALILGGLKVGLTLVAIERLAHFVR